MQVALLGGSFNPPHVGHLLAAQYVHATQGVDEVWLMPTFRHPFGKVTAPFEHRVRMCEQLCRETSGWLKTSEVESEVGKDGRTVDTLDFLHARHPGPPCRQPSGVADHPPDLVGSRRQGRFAPHDHPRRRISGRACAGPGSAGDA